MSVLARGRAAALARMTSRCAVMRKTGTSTTDADGFKVPEWTTVYASLPLRLSGAPRSSAPSRTLDVGGVEVEIAVRTAHLPHTADDLRDGDLIEVTSGDNAGLVLRVVEAGWQDQATARRVPVMSIERPEEWS